MLALPELGPEQQAAVAAGETRWSVEVDGLVPELDRVDWVATADGAAAAEGETLDSIDPTRPLGRLSEGAREHLPGELDSSHVLTALAAEALGVARRAHEIAVEYAKERQQFGKRIGVYQAIAHPLADSFGDIELARSLMWAAAWKLGERPRGGAGCRGGREGLRRGDGGRVLPAGDPGSRRDRLHVGAPPPPLLEAVTLAAGVRRVPGSAPGDSRGPAAGVGRP